MRSLLHSSRGKWVQTQALHALKSQGNTIRAADLAFLSPYAASKLKRFDDYPTWVSCWTDDAVLDGIGQLLTGKAQIQAFADTYEDSTRSKLTGLKHYTVNILSIISGDTATSRSYLQLVKTTEKGVKIVFTGHYEDTLRRVNGQWQFARRKLHQDMPPPGRAAA
ncbi:MAG: nuclear transport factor 2 family protein [Betaproteobacteria bacterium]